MYIALWILLCLFASIGAVATLSWLVAAICRPAAGASPAYRVIVLEKDVSELEAQLRYQLHLTRWSASPRPEMLILLDTGLDSGCRDITRNMLSASGIVGAMVSTPDELPCLIMQARETEKLYS